MGLQFGPKTRSFSRLWKDKVTRNHDVLGEVGKREGKELSQVSDLILTSAARFAMLVIT